MQTLKEVNSLHNLGILLYTKGYTPDPANFVLLCEIKEKYHQKPESSLNIHRKGCPV